MPESYDFIGYLNEEGSGIDLSHWRPLAPLLRKYKDKRLIVTLVEYKKHRSDAQNRYFHGPLISSVKAFYRETEGVDYDTDEVKAIIYQRVLGRKIKITMVDGVEVIAYEGKRLSSMKTHEFAKAIEKIFLYYDEKDWYIPPPPDRGLHTITEIISIEQGYKGDDRGDYLTRDE
jgi:hypothetical protein